jgi:hypothetical protein
MKLVGAIAGALLVLFFASPAFAEGTLAELRKDARTDDVLPPDDDDHAHHACEPDVYDVESDVWFGGEAVWLVFGAPFWLPHRAVGDSLRKEGFFPPFPYEDAQGSMYIDPGVVVDKHRRWMGRMRAEYADDFGGMSHWGGQLLLDTCLRLGIDTEANFRQEEVSVSDRDELWTGDLNFVYRFAQSERFQMRSGLGFNWLDDEAQADFGFNFTYGVDVFPIRPLSLSAVIDWGTVGHAGLFHARATIGLLFGRWETYFGYDYYDVGDAQINGLLGGFGMCF